MERTLSSDAAAKICNHMNEDHADAVAGYARAFGNVAHVDAARIIALDGHAMELEIDSGAERIVSRIPFDHVLADSNDARDTLIAMARQATTDA